MTEGAFSGSADARRDYFAKEHQGDIQWDPRDDWRGTYVGCLAQPARRFILSIRVVVWGYLQKEQQGEQSQDARQRPYKSRPGFVH